MQELVDARGIFTETRIPLASDAVVASSSGKTVICAEITRAMIYRIEDNCQNAKLVFEFALKRPVLRIFADESCFILQHTDVSCTKVTLPDFQIETLSFPQALMVYDRKGELLAYGDVVSYKGLIAKTEFPIVDAILCEYAGKEYIVVATHWIEVFIVSNGALELYKQSNFDGPCKLAASGVAGVFAIGSTDGAVSLFDLRTLKSLTTYEVQPLRIEYLHFLASQPDLLFCGFTELFLVRTGFVYAEALQIDEADGFFLHFAIIPHGFCTFIKVFNNSLTISVFQHGRDAELWLDTLLEDSNDYIGGLSDIERDVLKLQYQRDFSGSLRIISERLNAALEQQQIAQAKRYFDMYRPIMDFLADAGFKDELKPEEFYQDYAVSLYRSIPKSTPLDCCIRPTIPDQQKMQLYKFIIELIEMRARKEPDLRIFVQVEDFIKIAPTIISEQLTMEFMNTATHFELSAYHPSYFVDFLISCYGTKNNAFLKACLRPLCPSIFCTSNCDDEELFVQILQIPVLRECRDDRFEDIFNPIVFSSQNKLTELAEGPQSIVAKCVLKAAENDSTNAFVQKYIRDVEMPILQHFKDNSFVDEACHQIADELRDELPVDEISVVVYMFSLLTIGHVQHVIDVFGRIRDFWTEAQGYLEPDELFAFERVIESVTSYVVWPAILRELDVDAPVYWTEELIGVFLGSSIISENITPKRALLGCDGVFGGVNVQEELCSKLEQLRDCVERKAGDFDEYTLQQRREIGAEIQALVFNFRQHKFDESVAARLEDLEVALSSE